MHLPTGQGLGLHRLRGHLGWVLLTSDLGSFADLRPGEFCHSRSPWWSATFLRAHNALGAGMERASGLGWRQNLPKKRQKRPKPYFHASPRARLSPGVWASCGKQPKQNKAKLSFPCCPFPAVLSLLSFLCKPNQPKN